MPDIRVQPRRNARNMLPLALPLLLALLAIVAFWASRDHGPNRGNFDQQALPMAPIAHQGRIWVPQGAVVLLPDRQMREVGRTTEGESLYAAPVPMGGGGGMAEPVAGAQPTYRRIAEDQYQRVTLVQVTPPGVDRALPNHHRNGDLD